MNIITNNQPRPLVSYADLPNDDERFAFGYLLDEDRLSYRLVQYKGHWYDVFDTEASRQAGRDIFPGWDGFVSESFFSGVLFRFVGDDEVICGRYYA